MELMERSVTSISYSVVKTTKGNYMASEPIGITV